MIWLVTHFLILASQQLSSENESWSSFDHCDNILCPINQIVEHLPTEDLTIEEDS